MKINTTAIDVLALFAQYGFRKVSMSDIARTVNLSRQSIYNQFGSKEAVLDWSIKSFLSETVSNILAELEKPSDKPQELLAEAFQQWIGNHVPLLRSTPHGGELMDMAIASAQRSEENYEGHFMEAITAFIETRELTPDDQTATETAYVLHLASKGLMLKVHTSEDFAIGMQRVLRVIFR